MNIVRTHHCPGILLLLLLVVLPGSVRPFGFHAHRIINRMAVFTLPPEMIGLYKQHIEFLSERSIDPDRMAHAVEGEAPRHYIDIDHYGDDPFTLMPRQWDEALELYGEDTLVTYGVLPWHIHVMMQRLTRAFRERNTDRILLLSAHLGHYIADACTPLHTTKDYNGRYPSQRGIHAFWESRLPELYAHDYDYLAGRAEYLPDPLETAWALVEISHLKVDTIYQVFDSLLTSFPADQVYSHELRGQSVNRVYSPVFSEAFHQSLNGMVERQMRLAVRTTGDFWFTAWVNAGQPELEPMEERAISSRLLRRIKNDLRRWEKAGESKSREKPL